MSASIVTALAEWSSLPVEGVKAYVGKDSSSTGILAIRQAIHLFATANKIRHEDAESVLQARLRELRDDATAAAAAYNLIHNTWLTSNGRLEQRRRCDYKPSWIGRWVDGSDPAVKEEAVKLSEKYWTEWLAVRDAAKAVWAAAKAAAKAQRREEEEEEAAKAAAAAAAARPYFRWRDVNGNMLDQFGKRFIPK